MKTQDYTVVGTRPIRHDGFDKVTGRALFGADLQIPGLLHGHILRSPHAHARIRGIDVSKAVAFPGVKAVITAVDLPKGPDRLVDYGDGPMRLQYLRGNILADGKVLYKGHAVAAVAAVSPHVAEEAAGLIEVDYEILPCVLTVLDAMREDAPILLEDLQTVEFGEQTGKVSNVAEHFRHVLGNLDQGFAEADAIVEREFHTATVHQGYIEPQSATALWNNDGRAYIWCSTQGAFWARDQIAFILDLPVSRVKVTPMEVGGAFGGKIRVYVEPIAALLSKKAGFPVRIVMPRRMSSRALGPRPGHISG